MPFMELTYPEGALEPEARTTLAEGLTTALLRAERAPDTQFFRDVTWLNLNELPAHAVISAGAPVAKPTFKLDVTTPEGALSDRRREELVGAATGLIREAAGIPDEEALRVWVLCHEVAEGSWGAGGHVIRFEQLRESGQGPARCGRGRAARRRRELTSRSAMRRPSRSGSRPPASSASATAASRSSSRTARCRGSGVTRRTPPRRATPATRRCGSTTTRTAATA